MKNPISLINEMIQKGILKPIDYNFSSFGLDHNKQFICSFNIDDYGYFSGTAKSKKESHIEALEKLLTVMDIDKQNNEIINKPVKLNKPIGSYDKEIVDPVSRLQIFLQKNKLNNPSYVFSENTNDQNQKQFNCELDLFNQYFQFTSSSKSNAKKHVAYLALKYSESLDIPEKETKAIKGKVQTVNTMKTIHSDVEDPISILNQLHQIENIVYLDYGYTDVINNEITCTCYVNKHETTATSTSKLKAKKQASQEMMNLLVKNNHDFDSKRKLKSEKAFLVEPNECAAWINSICPTDIKIKKLSWYLTNDCVLIHLDNRKPILNKLVDILKSEIENETGLLVLINRERKSQKAIEILKKVTDENGYINNIKTIQQIALGSSFKPQQYPEPFIFWDNRIDHTKDHCFTIDSKTSIDLDDAFSIKVNTDKSIIIHIHIADVSFLVHENTKDDKDAQLQCFTYYGIRKQLPMIPDNIMYQASLLPHKDRMCWTVKMELDHNGNILDYKIYPSVIRSKFRLDQKTIAMLISNKSSQQSNEFKALYDMSDILKKQRITKGGLGDIIEENTGYQLVQEFMLLANKCVAEHCLNNNIPIPYRIHKFPDGSENIKEMYNEYQNHKQLLTHLGRASYSSECSDHDALAFKAYCHFTSPIRRYADLVLQRQLSKSFYKEDIASTKEIESVCDVINECEQELDFNQTSIRYLEALEKQYQQANKPVNVIVDDVKDNILILKALSQRHSFKLKLNKEANNNYINIGDELRVIQLSKFDVQNELFYCVLDNE